MKKHFIFMSALIALGFVLSTFNISAAASGKALFMKKGCNGCHSKAKGSNKPFPTKQKLARNSYSTFANCIKKGRPGTAMTPKNLSTADMKAIHKWLQKFK